MDSAGEIKNRDYGDVLTVEELADYLRIGRTRAFALVASGEISSFRIGRSRRIRLADAQE